MERSRERERPTEWFLSLFYHLLWLSAAAFPHSANEINARDIRRNFKYYHSAAPWGIHTCHENISERACTTKFSTRNQLKSSLVLRESAYLIKGHSAAIKPDTRSSCVRVCVSIMFARLVGLRSVEVCTSIIILYIVLCTREIGA